jgi:uncharacterized protein
MGRVPSGPLPAASPGSGPLTGRTPIGRIPPMDRDQVIAKLREHEPELKAAGIMRLSLFGSTARGDRRADSDIDLLASFDATRRISLLDIAGMEIRLSQLLSCPVDLIEEGTLKPRVQTRADAESVRAF